MRDLRNPVSIPGQCHQRCRPYFEFGFANHDQTTTFISDSWTHVLEISKARQVATVIGVDPVEVASCETDQHV